MELNITFDFFSILVLFSRLFLLLKNFIFIAKDEWRRNGSLSPLGEVKLGPALTSLG